MDDLISRPAVINTLNVGAELLRRVLDDMDVVGVEREKYEWGLGLIESYISDMKELPSAQPDDDRLERCRFEYVNACKILAHRTPDTRKKDINDAYAVVRALNPIFGEEGF